MKYSILLLPIVLLFATPLLHAKGKVYQWVDEQGQTHFSDTAPHDTLEFTITNHTQASPEKPAEPVEALISQEEKVDNATETDKLVDQLEYQISIVSPLNDAAIRSNNGMLEVRVKTTPKKEKRSRYLLSIDGKNVISEQSAGIIRTYNVDRGTHLLQVQLIDENDTVMATSHPIAVHVKRATKK